MTDCRRNRVIEETRQKCKYIVKICFVTAFLALANVLKRRIKVSLRKKKTQKVGAVGFDSLRNVHFF